MTLRAPLECVPLAYGRVRLSARLLRRQRRAGTGGKLTVEVAGELRDILRAEGTTALLVTRTGESGDSDAQSDPAGISGSDEVTAARRIPGSARNRSSRCGRLSASR